MKKIVKKIIIMFLIASIFVYNPTDVQAKTYKLDSVSSDQIAKELKKSFKITNIDKIQELEKPNTFKTYSTFSVDGFEEKGSVAVFEDEYDATSYYSLCQTISVVTSMFSGETMTINYYRYKNIVITLPDSMSDKEMLKYYKKLKKIVK